jgi:hypothetical protein
LRIADDSELIILFGPNITEQLYRLLLLLLPIILQQSKEKRHLAKKKIGTLLEKHTNTQTHSFGKKQSYLMLNSAVKIATILL